MRILKRLQESIGENSKLKLIFEGKRIKTQVSESIEASLMVIII